jgi:hypothetical protein
MRPLIALAVAASIVLTAAPAIAGSDWDPDDVEGPFDLRWVGATFTADGRFVLEISFYEGFDARVIPHARMDRREVRVEMSEFLDGYLKRRGDGRIVLVWGDMGSSCCWRDRVRFPSPNEIRVALPIIDDDVPYRVQAITTWTDRQDRRIRDRTGIVRLGDPPG